jgi:hypothetical protein
LLVVEDEPVRQFVLSEKNIVWMDVWDVPTMWSAVAYTGTQEP